MALKQTTAYCKLGKYKRDESLCSRKSSVEGFEWKRMVKTRSQKEYGVMRKWERKTDGVICHMEVRQFCSSMYTCK